MHMISYWYAIQKYEWTFHNKLGALKINIRNIRSGVLGTVHFSNVVDHLNFFLNNRSIPIHYAMTSLLDNDFKSLLS